MLTPAFLSSFPEISESKNVQTLAYKTAALAHGLGYTSIIACLPVIMKSLHADTSKRVYLQDVQHFVRWLYEHGLPIDDSLTFEHMTDYYWYLETTKYMSKGVEHKYSRATINRMFAVASKVLQTHVKKDLLSSNPATDVDTKASGDETTHAVLTKRQAGQLLDAIDTSTIRGKMDYAMVSLMLRCGIRRDECRMLNMADIALSHEHHIAYLDAKGGDRQVVKIPPDVWRYISEYSAALQKDHPRRDARIEAPLFIAFRKGDHPSLQHDESGKLIERRIDIKAIETMVKALGVKIGVPTLTPHGLRATFITLALENNATLTQTQYAARHKDPRTTERYQKRKLNLDDNAVDKLSFLARPV